MFNACMILLLTLLSLHCIVFFRISFFCFNGAACSSLLSFLHSLSLSLSLSRTRTRLETLASLSNIVLKKKVNLCVQLWKLLELFCWLKSCLWNYEIELCMCFRSCVILLWMCEFGVFFFVELRRFKCLGQKNCIWFMACFCVSVHSSVFEYEARTPDTDTGNYLEKMNLLNVITFCVGVRHRRRLW